VLDFWFGDLPPGGKPADDRVGLWFRRSDETDAAIRDRFGATLTAARAGELAGWQDDPRTWLALEHSEELADQDASVAKFTALAEAASEAQRPMARAWLDYAHKHRDPASGVEVHLAREPR
jgi:uncharacterized protein (DUF924 family)